MTIQELYIQSMLAEAAYANLQNSTPNTQALIAKGMGGIQANNFIKHWRVIDQYNDTSDVSATVFQEIATGTEYLAIRGTQPTVVGDLAANHILDQGFPSFLNQQFILFTSTLSDWLTNNVFQNMITNNK